MERAPSIFNDVLGPVMRGPSSSHSAAANRIGRIARDLAGESVVKLAAYYDTNGSLVTTHKDQGTDLGLYSGILGWEPDDARLPTYPAALREAGIEVEVNYLSYDAPHPNFYRLEITGESGTIHHFDAISTGGGMIELKAIDGIKLGGVGDYHSTLFWLDESPADALVTGSELATLSEDWAWLQGDGGGLLRFDSRQKPSSELVTSFAQELGAKRSRVLGAVLPILSRKAMSVPFTRCGEMEAHPDFADAPLWESAACYEAARGGITPRGSHREDEGSGKNHEGWG